MAAEAAYNKRDRVYPRALLLQLRASPLVPSGSSLGLPPLAKWYGEYETPHTPHHKTQDLPRERGVRGERNTREDGRRERGRERDLHINGDAHHDPAQPFGAMGDFRLPKSATKRSDRDQEASYYDRGSSDSFRPNGHMAAGDAYRPAGRDKERDDRPMVKKLGRAEEGGWRTGRTLSDRAPEAPIRRMDDGRRNDSRRDHEPAWMDDEPSSKAEAEPAKPRVSAWSKGPPVHTPAADPVELGGHVDMLQAFKAQMKAQEAKEKEAADPKGTIKGIPPATQTYKTHDDKTPVAKQVDAFPSSAPAASESMPLSLASLGLTTTKKEPSDAPAASTSRLSAIDPAISSMSQSAPGEAPRDREASGSGDDGSRPRASRFAKFFKPEQATASATPSVQPAAPIAPAASAPAQTRAEQRPPSDQRPLDTAPNAADNADQESFRRLMAMLQMSASPAPPANQPKQNLPMPNNFSPPPQSFSPVLQQDNRQQYGPPGLPMHQRTGSAGPMQQPHPSFAAHQPLPPAQPGFMGPPRGAMPPALPSQGPPGFGPQMPFNGPPGFGGMRPPGFPYPGPPMPPPHHMSPPPMPPASSGNGVDSLLAMFSSQAGR